jgi:hypothetical protein
MGRNEHSTPHFQTTAASFFNDARFTLNHNSGSHGLED